MNTGRADIKVTGGRYGLGSKDTPPSNIFAVFEELKKDIYYVEDPDGYQIAIVPDRYHPTFFTRRSRREANAADRA